jgi:hypothetical protein
LCNCVLVETFIRDVEPAARDLVTSPHCTKVGRGAVLVFPRDLDEEASPWSASVRGANLDVEGFLVRGVARQILKLSGIDRFVGPSEVIQNVAGHSF